MCSIVSEIHMVYYYLLVKIAAEIATNTKIETMVNDEDDQYILKALNNINFNYIINFNLSPCL